MNNFAFVGSSHINSIDYNFSNTSNYILNTSNSLVHNYVNTSNYIFNTSNSLASNISNTSNILFFTSNILQYNSSNFTTISSNQIINQMNQLIAPQSETTLLLTYTHTYIYNKNLLGEIRFWVASTSNFPVVAPTGVPDYRVKIDIDGKLKVYYTYDPLINATWFNGWMDVGNTMVGTIASTANLGISVGALEAQIVSVQESLQTQIEGVYAAMTQIAAGDISADSDVLEAHAIAVTGALDELTTLENLQASYTDISNFIQSGNASFLSSAVNTINLTIGNNPITSFFLGAGGVAFGIVYGIAQNSSFNNILNITMKNAISSNVNVSPDGKRSLYEYNSNVLIASNIINICEDYFYLSLNQGFINSNFVSQQIIPNILSSNIYNSCNLYTNFLTVNSNTYISGNLNVAGSSTLSSTLSTGGNISCSGSTISITGGNANLSLGSGGIENLGVASGSGAFCTNAVANDLILRGKSGNSVYLLTGSGNAAVQIDSNNNFIIFNNITIDSNTYLSGTLNVAGNSILNSLTCTSEITAQNILLFSSSNYSIPSVGILGGNGDRIIIYQGTSTTHPFSIGYNNLSGTTFLWYSVPTSASHIWYVGGNGAMAYNGTTLTAPSISGTSLAISGTSVFNNYINIINNNTLGQAFIQNNVANKSAYINFNNTSNGTNNVFIGMDGSNNKNIEYQAMIMGTTSSNSIIFCTNNNESMRITGNGNVGIATTNPNSYQLYVNGNFWANNIGAKNMITIQFPSTTTSFNGTNFYAYDLDLTKYTSFIYTANSSSGITQVRKFRICTFLNLGAFTDSLGIFDCEYSIYMSFLSNYYPTTYNGLNLIANGTPNNRYLENIMSQNIFIIRNTFNYLTLLSRNSSALICCIIEDQL